ncbi:MAG: hypothetical protein AB7T14_02700 [Candidatus Methylacidiphilaceae bacterium]
MLVLERSVRLLVAVAVTGSLWVVQPASAEEAAPAPERRVIRFENLPALEKKEGPHPKEVWVYGRFTARTAVSGGVFLAAVNEGVNWPDWEENFSVVNNPGDFVFRRVVFRAKMPLPEIRRGTKFAIPKTQPAKLIEVARVDGIIARLALVDAPTIESQDGAAEAVHPSQAREATGLSGYPPQRIVPFQKLGSIAKKEGVHPENLWTWGKFSARSNLREGVATATPAGLETRRQLELGISGLATFYLPYLLIGAGEPIHRVIFHAYEPRTIRNGDLIDIPKESPCRVKRIFLTGGVLAWLDLDPPAPAAIPVQLGSDRERVPAEPAVPAQPYPAEALTAEEVRQ